MKNLLRIAVALTLTPAVAGTLAAQAVASPSITLFSSGRVLVRRTLPVSIASGVSTATVALGDFSPATLALLEPGVRLIRVDADDAVSEETLLRRNVGRTFAIDTGKGGVRNAKLVALDPERWEWADRPGQVRFGRIGAIAWPRELVPAMATADITMQSDRARQSVRVMYQTTGSSWAASYQLFLGANGHLDGNALISSGTLDLADTEVQLASGDIGQGQVPQPVMYKSMAASPRMAGAQAGMINIRGGADADEEAIGESHLYTLPGRTTFRPGSSFTSALFDPAPAKADRRYVLSGALQYYGGINQDPAEQAVPVRVAYHVDRKLGTPLGDLALPDGYVAIYDTDKGGRVQLVGQGSIGHTAPGQELLVDAGTAFDVTGRRVQTDYTTSRIAATTPSTPTRTQAISAYRVTLKNAKDSAVTVEVREDHSGEWSVLESSAVAVKKSATRTVFNVLVAAKDSTVLTYRVRVVW